MAVICPAAGKDASGGKNRDMAVAAVAASVDHSFHRSFGNFESSRFIFVQRPQVILLIKVSLTALRLIFFEFFITYGQKLPIFLRRHACIQIAAGGNIA